MFSRFAKFAPIIRFQQRSLGYAIIKTGREYSNRKRCKTVVPKIPFYIAAIWGITKSKDNEKSSVKNREILLVKADALFDQEKYQDLHQLLSGYKDDDDVEILWRLSRALYKMSKLESKEAEAKKMVYDAYDIISRALSLKDDHWAVQKWIAILLNTKTSYEGTKIKIRELYNIKKHMLRASELNPKDATVLYMIGCWCYQVADLAWYQRKIAAAIFGEPPTSSFEEALLYFEKAEQADPNFYGNNLLMLGKTYLKLSNKDKALKYLKLASEYPAKNDDDQEAKQEALKILNSI